MKKWLLIGLALILLISSGGVIGCGKGGITGTYVNEDNPDEYLELRADGTYYLYEGGIGVTGEWEVEGNELRLELWGFVVTGEIRGNKIYDPDGKVWVKQSDTSEQETSTPPESTTHEPTYQEASPDDIEWLAIVIASEAGSVYDEGGWVRCTDEERSAVGWTVLNRLSSGTFGVTIEEIVTAPAQYAHNQQPTQEIRELARRLLEEEIPDATGGATHFFSPISMPTEGESTAGFDVGGGLHEVPGIVERVYFPSWTMTYAWVGDIDNVTRAYFMFYRPTSRTANQVVTFTDPNLEAAIREAINKPESPIYASELEGLTSLDAPERNITDLTGLEYCANLTNLDLRFNQISDISPLASLANLTMLRIHRNQISDISPLISLTNLTYLDLEVNQISDISPLISLTKLEQLFLNSNQISDISPLIPLTKLDRLNLNDNQISDISPLASLTNLTSLILLGNEISNISPLASLTNLTSLSLYNNQITNISSLASLTNLINLFLGHNQISDISSLASLTNLTYLDLEVNQISNIKPLVANSGLSDGDTVTLMNNPLSTTSVNVYIPQLEERGVEVDW